MTHLRKVVTIKIILGGIAIEKGKVIRVRKHGSSIVTGHRVQQFQREQLKKQLRKVQLSKISMMVPLYVTEPPAADNPAIQAMKKYTNSNLELTWVPSSAYNAKVTAMIAANDLPQIMTILNHRDAGVLNAIRAGMFWGACCYLKIIQI